MNIGNEKFAEKSSLKCRIPAEGRHIVQELWNGKKIVPGDNLQFSALMRI